MGEVVTNRLLAAMNAHDLDAFVACFAPNYHSEQPAHPSRAFDGSDKVRENWTSVFAGMMSRNRAPWAVATASQSAMRLTKTRVRTTFASEPPSD